MLKVALTLAAMLAVAGQPSFAAEDAMSIVSRLDAQYDAAWNTLDARKLAEQFATDAIVLPPTAPAQRGRQAVIDVFEPIFKNKWSNHRLEPINAQRIDDRAIVAASHWTATLTDAGGKATHYHGDVAQAFEKTGEQWMLKVSSWNVLADAK